MDLERLASRLSPDARIAISDGERALYSRDCWPYLTLMARAGTPSLLPPDAVVYAADEGDVTATIAWCRETRTPLVPVGALSGVVGGAVPVAGGIALDLKQLDMLDASLAEHGIVCAGAGWLGARLEHELNRRGFTLGHFPSSIGCSTLGGYVATRSAGQLSSRHGKIEDLVVGVRYIDANGRAIDTFAAGHDLTALIVGSEGTLGVVTRVWLRVEARPIHRRYRGYLAEGLPPAFSTMRGLMQGGHRPAVMRLYDEFDTYISGARKAGRPSKPPGMVKRLTARATADLDVAAAKHAALRAANAVLGRTMGATVALNAGARRVYPGCLLIVVQRVVQDEPAHCSGDVRRHHGGGYELDQPRGAVRGGEARDGAARVHHGALQSCVRDGVLHLLHLRRVRGHRRGLPGTLRGDVAPSARSGRRGGRRRHPPPRRRAHEGRGAERRPSGWCRAVRRGEATGRPFRHPESRQVVGHHGAFPGTGCAMTSASPRVDKLSASVTVDASATWEEAESLARSAGLTLDGLVDWCSQESVGASLARRQWLPPLWPAHTAWGACIALVANTRADATYRTISAPRTSSGPDLRGLWVVSGHRGQNDGA